VNQEISAVLDSYKNGVTPSELVLAAAGVQDDYFAIEQRLPNVEDLALDSGVRISSGTQRAFEGIPFSVKANIDVAGIVTTNGTAMENQPATKSARIVDLLCEAGAIPVFTTTMAELAIGAVTDNAHTGICVTPANPNLHAGGSSGGSGGGRHSGAAFAGVSGQGHAGGVGLNSGGGGAGSVGINAGATERSGGNGLSNTLRTGIAETRAGGGGGPGGTVGGSGGGGNGGNNTTAVDATAGTVNTGSGGGGSRFSEGAGAAGGSGIVVIRYEIAPSV
jgi:hypothetical protein